mmetsp:Transcript_49192/g.107251  ORF Transcript_49192/g.107251 Transcript_49192/m.107251 type:complete len:136 (-) Transcript_49192:383-790(-)
MWSARVSSLVQQAPAARVYGRCYVACAALLFVESHRQTSWTRLEQPAPQLLGQWRQDQSRCETLAPFLKGLGVPSIAAVVVDRIPVRLTITREGGSVSIEDRTFAGTNCTTVELGAPEIEKSTRNGRKKIHAIWV